MIVTKGEAEMDELNKSQATEEKQEVDFFDEIMGVDASRALAD